jgi:hypothetical protein
MFYIRLGERQENTMRRTPSKPPNKLKEKKKKSKAFKKLAAATKSIETLAAASF